MKKKFFVLKNKFGEVLCTDTNRLKLEKMKLDREVYQKKTGDIIEEKFI